MADQEDGLVEGSKPSPVREIFVTAVFEVVLYLVTASKLSILGNVILIMLTVPLLVVGVRRVEEKFLAWHTRPLWKLRKDVGTLRLENARLQAEISSLQTTRGPQKLLAKLEPSEIAALREVIEVGHKDAVDFEDVALEGIRAKTTFLDLAPKYNTQTRYLLSMAWAESLRAWAEQAKRDEVTHKNKEARDVLVSLAERARWIRNLHMGQAARSRITAGSAEGLGMKYDAWYADCEAQLKPPVLRYPEYHRVIDARPIISSEERSDLVIFETIIAALDRHINALDGLIGAEYAPSHGESQAPIAERYLPKYGTLPGTKFPEPSTPDTEAPPSTEGGS